MKSGEGEETGEGENHMTAKMERKTKGREGKETREGEDWRRRRLDKDGEGEETGFRSRRSMER